MGIAECGVHIHLQTCKLAYLQTRHPPPATRHFDFNRAFEYSVFMRIGTNSIVTNAQGHVLLIQRNDSRSFAPPGGALDLNELPPESAAREVAEETGLEVAVTRLLGLYLWPNGDGFLSFVFHCRPLGGALRTSAESLHVGFHDPQALPRPMADLHRQRVAQSVAQSLAHADGVQWAVQRTSWRTRLTYLALTQVVYRWMDWRRQWMGLPPYQPPPRWRVSAFVAARNAAGAALWVKRPWQEAWSLPGGAGHTGEAPWTTAVRHARVQTGLHVRLTGLSGVYLARGRSEMALVFTAAPAAKPPTGAAYFTPGAEPAACAPQHAAYAADAVGGAQEPVFRFSVAQTSLVARSSKDA